MITIEIPERKVKSELEALEQFKDSAYAAGARHALAWLLHQTPLPPSFIAAGERLIRD